MQMMPMPTCNIETVDVAISEILGQARMKLPRKIFSYLDAEILKDCFTILYRRYQRFSLPKKKIKTIYTHKEQVHTTSVEITMKDSFLALKKKWENKTFDQTEMKVLLSKLGVSDETIKVFFEHLSDEIIIPFLDCPDIFSAFIYIFPEMYHSEHRDEILKIFVETIEGEEYRLKCSNGKVSKLINCLSGFSDLVDIRISSDDHIKGILGGIMTKFQQGLISKENIIEMVKAVLDENNISDLRRETYLSIFEDEL